MAVRRSLLCVSLTDASDITYVFELPTWEELDLYTVELTKVFRQDNKALVEVLCKLRRASRPLSTHH